MAVKQKQSQKQNVNVNINLGEKKKKRKPKKRNIGKKNTKRKESQPLIFQTPNPPLSWVNNPLPQKQLFVYPEGETASQLGLLSNVRVPLVTRPNILREPLRSPTLTDESTVKIKPTKEPVEYSLFEDNPVTAPSDEPIPTFSTSLDEPATEIIGDIPLTAEEERQREEELSRLAEEEKQKRAIETFKKVRKGQKVKEEERLKKETMTGIITGQAPQIEQTKPKRGRPLGSTNKPTFNPNQSALGFSQQVVTAEAIPAELTAQGASTLTAPLGEQPSAQLQPKITFLGQPAAQPAEEPAKAETLQRQRKVIERATPEAAVRFVN